MDIPPIQTSPGILKVEKNYSEREENEKRRKKQADENARKNLDPAKSASEGANSFDTSV
ncbi:MAG: hypothetical protein LBL35_04610 [Clostridiales bacterium]|jgi:hypothetical protein|nr:hypothetical protein [Clostridiales bacterium]